MFWKVLGWVGAAFIVAVGVTAFVAKGGGEKEKGSEEVQQTPEQPGKKFNF